MYVNMIRPLKQQPPQNDRVTGAQDVPFTRQQKVKLERVGLILLPLRAGSFSPKAGSDGLEMGVH